MSRKPDKKYFLGKFCLQNNLLTTPNGDVLKLTSRCADIFESLSFHKNGFVTNHKIIERYDKPFTNIKKRSFDVYMVMLKRLFKEDPNIYIKSIREKGLLIFTDGRKQFSIRKQI
jgi:DNA-binding response OmpR family regulator